MGSCSGCTKQFDLNELDLSGYCFDCANGGPPKVNMRGYFQTLLTATVDLLSAKKGVSRGAMKKRLVSEFAEPEKPKLTRRERLTN